MNYRNVEDRFKEEAYKITVPENRTLVREWLTDLRFEGISNKRRVKLFSQMCKLHQFGAITEPLQQYTTSQFKQTIITIRDLDTYILKTTRTEYVKKYTKATKTDYIRCVQQFFNWFEPKDTRLDSVDTVRATKELYKACRSVKKDKQISERKREHILTIEDLALLLRHETLPVYRAVYSLLFYNGIRIGGIMNIKLKDIVMHEQVWDVTITDKTGTDTIFVFEPRHYITQYLREKHPNPENKELHLFYCNRGNKPLTSKMVWCRLRKIRQRIQKIKPEWNKKVNPHWFRHSWGTRNRSKMSDTLFKKQGKWSQNSTAPATYDHSNTDDYRKEFQEHKGIASEEQLSREIWLCHTCNTENTPDVELCKCGTPANFSTWSSHSTEFSEQEAQTFKYLQEVMNDPLLLAKLQNLLR